MHTYLFLSPNVAVILSHGTQQQFAILLQGSLPDHEILEHLYVSSILWVFVCVSFSYFVLMKLARELFTIIHRLHRKYKLEV